MASGNPESRVFSQIFVSRPGNLSIKSGDGLRTDHKNKKARVTCLERPRVSDLRGLEIAKAGCTL